MTDLKSYLFLIPKISFMRSLNPLSKMNYSICGPSSGLGPSPSSKSSRKCSVTGLKAIDFLMSKNLWHESKPVFVRKFLNLFLVLIVSNEPD